MATIEDLDRRVTALENAQTAKGENVIVRLEQKVDAVIPAVAGMVSESERRTGDRVSASERRMVDALNERFDAVMDALDKLKNPPA
jgi:hypothetical protein